ncbi:MAG: hypothetical protein AB8V05_06220 [Francisella endosymbiont of Hyalomma scupense]
MARDLTAKYSVETLAVQMDITNRASKIRSDETVKKFGRIDTI